MRSFKLCLLAAGLAASAFAQGVVSLPVITTVPAYSIPYSFPPLGLAYTETLQVNIIGQNPGLLQGDFSAISPNGACTLCGSFLPVPTTTSSVTLTSPISAPTSCSGTVTFKDASGKTIGSPVTFTIATSGQVFSAPLPFSASGLSGFRGIIVPSVQQNVPANTGSCSLSMTLETFDTNTGVTHSVLTPSSQSTALQGIFSVISGQPPVLN